MIPNWSDRDIHQAIEALRSSSGIGEACRLASAMIGREITSDSLDKAFRRRKLGTPGKYLGVRPPSVAERFGSVAAHGAGSGFGEIDIDLSDLNDQDDTPTIVAKAPNGPHLSEVARRLVAELRSGRTLEAEALCNKLDVSPRRVREAIDETRAAGYVADVAGSYVGRAPPAPGTVDDAKPVVVAQAGERRIFAVASDIHVGSKFFLKEAFQDFIHKAYDRGARCILGPGDITDGVYKHSQWEEYAHGFHEQAHEAASVFPKLPGLEYYSIAGNHDQTHEEGSGLEVCSAYENVFREHGRADFHMLGSRGAYLRLGAPGERHGLLVELWHPKGGGAYALSYKLQKHIEGYAPGLKPDACFMGHFHQQCYFVQRGVHAISSGTFHGGLSPFGKSLGVSPSIGGWIVEYALTDGGTVRDYEPTWVSYYERETIREVALP